MTSPVDSPANPPATEPVALAPTATEPPRRPWRTWLRRASLVLTLLYVGLHLMPGLLFPHTLTVGDLTFHARQPLPPEARTVAERAAALIARSELAIPGRRQHLYVCDHPWLFALFGPASRQAFAFVMPATGAVFIARADFVQDRAFSQAPRYNERSLSGVIAHETTHGLIRQRLGLLGAWRLPTWIHQGYCDVIAGSGSYPEAEGRRRLLADEPDPAPSYRYDTARRMVQYLIEHDGADFAALVTRSGDHDAVLAATRRALAAETGPAAHPERFSLPPPRPSSSPVRQAGT